MINWNNTENIIHHLDNISHWNTLNPSIIIVDNKSEFDPTDLIQLSYPDTVVLRSTENLGFSGGNNLGLKHCLDNEIDYVLLLNHDAEISEGTVNALIKTMQSNPQIGAVGPLLQEGSLIFAGGRDISRHPATRIPYDNNGPLQRQVDYVPGTALLLRISTLQKIGLFDERFFFSGEVADLCFRMQKCGYICSINTTLLINHDIGQDTPMRERIHLYYSIRNRFLFLKKNDSPSKYVLQLFWVTYASFRAFGAIIRNKPHSARALILAVFDGVFGRFGNRNEYFIH